MLNSISQRSVGLVTFANQELRDQMILVCFAQVVSIVPMEQLSPRNARTVHFQLREPKVRPIVQLVNPVFTVKMVVQE